MKDSKELGVKDAVRVIFVFLGLLAVIGLIILPFAAKQFTTFGNNIDDIAEESFEKEREVLKEVFDYVGDVSYLITDKNKSSVLNPFSRERSYTYYFVGVTEDDVVYRLEVPAKLYNRTVLGDEVLFQGGSDEGYLMSMDGKDVVRKSEVKE